MIDECINTTAFIEAFKRGIILFLSYKEDILRTLDELDFTMIQHYFPSYTSDIDYTKADGLEHYFMAYHDMYYIKEKADEVQSYIENTIKDRFPFAEIIFPSPLYITNKDSQNYWVNTRIGFSLKIKI